VALEQRDTPAGICLCSATADVTVVGKIDEAGIGQRQFDPLVKVSGLTVLSKLAIPPARTRSFPSSAEAMNA
jgi:hypothetical protein